jgi:hypothetical protein
MLIRRAGTKWRRKEVSLSRLGASISRAGRESVSCLWNTRLVCPMAVAVIRLPMQSAKLAWGLDHQLAKKRHEVTCLEPEQVMGILAGLHRYAQV